MTTAVKRACDACHRRKVKCDGINPCRNCSASQLSCTYNAIPQKKGPKGSRAKVISELRETQRATSLSAKVQSRMNGLNSPPSTPSYLPTPGLVTSDIVKTSMDFFFANMYPVMPILHQQRLEQQAMYMDQNLDTYCLLASLSAFMMLQPGMGMPSGDPYGLENLPGANIVSATLLLEETIRVRKGYDYLDAPTLNSLCTNYFLFACYYGLELHDKAWFHLREATTLAHMIGMNKEETYLQYDNIEASRRRRLYWLLFIAERAYALQRHRPLTLQATINLPTARDDPTDPLAHQLNGFILQVNLFRPYDDAFVALWQKTRGDCSSSYLSSLQKQIQDALPNYLNEAQAQLSELPINQQWLKNMSWQLSMASGSGSDAGMAFQYPIDIARDLLPMVSHFPGGLGLLGLGLIEKLFNISCSLAEYLSLQPASRDPFSVGPHQHLHQLLNIVTVVRNGDHRFLPLLLSKVHEVLPRLANPMLQNAPENACNIDIFDGFGNAGMAQPAVFANEEFDNKFAIPRIDEMSNDSGSSSGGAPASNDMNSPFVSSPATMMSPGMEIPHGMPSDFNSIQEMMSPVNRGSANGGHSSQQGQHPQQQPHQQQHQQHPSMSYQNLNQMQNMGQAAPNMSLTTQNLGQGMNIGQSLSPGIHSSLNNNLSSPMNAGMNPNNMLQRQQPQRANSFAMTAPQQLRTVGDFQALQRANSDMSTISSLGINSMGAELDFNTLPR